MGFRLFKPRGATKKNYIARERDLYIALETFKEICKLGKIEKGYYIVQASNSSYRRAFDLSYSLVKFYTKYREESKSFMFKRNYLLSKTRGIFSNQEVDKSSLVDIYRIKCSQLDALPEDYFKMFHLNKTREVIPEIEEEEKEKDEE